MKFKDSELAHKYLDGKTGIEIGASAHNPFNLEGNCEFVDYTDDMSTTFKLEEEKLCGEKQKVDVVAPAWWLPYKSESLDYVLSSHVIEHCWNVLATLDEWARVLKPDGLIFMIIPHKERTFDKDLPRTKYQELFSRYLGLEQEPELDTHEHYSVWIPEDWQNICREDNWNLINLQDPDDKVGNGFTVVIQV